MSYSPKVIALAQHLNVSPVSITEPQDDEAGYFECGEEPGEYLVLTNKEADAACDEALNQYIDDCVMPEIPEAYRFYFDEKAWKRDAILSDGRGHTISSYDGVEHEERVLTSDGAVYFYIYRVN